MSRQASKTCRNGSDIAGNQAEFGQLVDFAAGAAKYTTRMQQAGWKPKPNQDSQPA